MLTLYIDNVSTNRTKTEAVLQFCLKRPYFQPNKDGEVPVPVTYTPGKGKLVLAVGGNASGKSFFRRVVSSYCHTKALECLNLSVEGRRNIATNPGLALVYGSEDYDSTGANSARIMTTAIKTSQGRDSDHVIFWDEPDLGLSDDWAASMGATIRSYTEEAPEHLVGAILVTHSRALLKELIPIGAHLLVFSEEPYTSIEQWINRPTQVRPLEDLWKENRKRFRLIQQALNMRNPK